MPCVPIGMDMYHHSSCTPDLAFWCQVRAPVLLHTCLCTPAYAQKIKHGPDLSDLACNSRLLIALTQ